MSRGRQRAEFARLVEVLAGAPWTAWADRLRGLADEGPRLARSLLRAYRHGALGPERWAELTGQPPRDPDNIDDTIRQLWDAFVKNNLADARSVGEWNQRITPGLLHRWAWQPRWHLVEQDEDLMLMEYELIPPMLALAADRRVPKRDYLIATVAHHARDWACQAVYTATDIAETWTRIAAWAPLARTAGAHALTAYLTRIGTYTVDQPVDRRGAVQRLLDLGRCSEPSRDEIDVRDVVDGHEGFIVHSGGNRRVHIDAATGRFTPAPTPGRRRK